jgi:16S rRNA (adenine1518-N6/adenine1519-N6)-dimethyltransferase
MFQKEVAQRICAPHGSKRMESSVLTQAYYEADYLFTTVGPEVLIHRHVFTVLFLKRKENYNELPVL